MTLRSIKLALRRFNWPKGTRSLFAVVLGLSAISPSLGQELKPFIVTEPVHSVDSIPFYAAVKFGYFKQAGIAVEVMTTEGGGRHISAVLSGDAQAFIGGPEHIAFAKAKGGRDVRAVASMANRANQYFVAAKSIEMPKGTLGDMLRGKRLAIGTRGGTGYSIVMYLLAQQKLDPQKDVTLIEIQTAGGKLAAVKAGQADIAVINEPFITQGMKQGIFSPPFASMPELLGPFAYTTVNVPADLIAKDPQLIAALVGGLKKGLEFTLTDRAGVEKLAKEEFPNLAPEDLQAVLDRALKDNLWQRDGAMPVEAWASLHRVVREGGLLDRDVPYEAIFEPRFLK